MPSIKHIKRRITSIKSTKQIMKAMNMVAASKLQKAKQRMDAVRPMFGDIQKVMDSVKAHEGAEDSMYFQERSVKGVAYIVITSDRGLCGGYNVNLCKAALEAMKNNAGKKEVIITVGNKGLEYLRRRGKDVLYKFEGPTENTTYEDAELYGGMLYSMFMLGNIDEAYVVYTGFKTVLSHEPKAVRIIPIGSDDRDSGGSKRLMIYDPDIKGFLDYAVPLYLNTFVYGAMVESSVCENAARMTSMDSAANNAAEIVEDLTLVYNRTRQSIITQEITEIVSGANAIQ